MATPNYSYEKRQRELAKKKKKEEKVKHKAERSVGDSSQDGASVEQPGDAPPESSSANSDTILPSG